MLNDIAIAWLRSRGIDQASAEAMGIATDRNHPVAKRDGGEWLSFPYERSGELITRKYRRIDCRDGDQKFSQAGGAPFKLCWNEDALKVGDGPVLLTEGEMDALALMQCGFERVLSIPDGAPQKPVSDDDSDKWSYVDDLVQRLSGERQIILAADGDQNGANLRDYLAKRLGKARCKYLRYPTGTKDANAVLVEHGVSAVRDMVASAPWISVAGVVKLKDLPPPREQEVHKIALGGPESGYDKQVSIMRGQLSVGTGVPGHGKSAHATAICMEMARHHKWKLGIGCFEDDAQLDYRRNVACYMARKPVDLLEQSDWDRADQYLDDRFCFFVEEEMGARMTVDWLLEKMEVAVVRYGADMIVIDPWSKLDHARDRSESENDYVGRTLNDLKRFARAFDVHVHIVAHPKKVMKRSDGQYEIPGGYDISGSAHWYNMPDLGMTSHRMVEKNDDITATIVTWKVKRHAIMGKPGFCKLVLDPDTGRYSDYHDQPTENYTPNYENEELFYDDAGQGYA